MTLGSSIGSVPAWGYGSIDSVVKLRDDNRGHTAGWNPPGYRFKIQDPLVHENSAVMITVDGVNPNLATPFSPICSVTFIMEGMFAIGCNAEPPNKNVANGSSLNYAVINPLFYLP